MADLFAGLSLAPSASNAAPAPAAANGTHTPAGGSPAKSQPKATTAAAVKPSAAVPPAAANAPFTDKLLGIIGPGSGPGSNSPIPAPPMPTASPVRAVSSSSSATSKLSTTAVEDAPKPQASPSFPKATAVVSATKKKKRSNVAPKVAAASAGSPSVTSLDRKTNPLGLESGGVVKVEPAASAVVKQSTPTKDPTTQPKPKDPPPTSNGGGKVPASSPPKAAAAATPTRQPSQTKNGGSSTKAASPSPRNRTASAGSNATKATVVGGAGPGAVHPDTPIPHADVALRLFRKFARKTRPQIAEEFGGSKQNSFLSYIFSSSSDANDPTAKRNYAPYNKLMDVIKKEDSDDPFDEKASKKTQDDVNIDAIMGQSGDTQEKAGAAVAAFGHLCKVWGHSSALMAESQGEAGTAVHVEFAKLLALAIDTATALVTHGCLDGVEVMSAGPPVEETKDSSSVDSLSAASIPVVQVLAESVFCADLSVESMELSAMKFLLSTGCRASPDTDSTEPPTSMLRGTHLLQSIRVLYHVYLTTNVKANQTTARASLQQLVTSVFVRMIASANATGNGALSSSPGRGVAGPPASDSHGSEHEDEDTNMHHQNPLKEEFPTENHRDAFLVLRSLCKLSMRSPPQDPSRHSHVGLQASGSNTLWDANEAAANGAQPPGSTFEGNNRDTELMTKVDTGASTASLIYTQAIHPALASKLLALDLLLYVLSNTDMKDAFLRSCGPQFRYAIRNYLCVSLLKNCTMDDTRVVNLSLRVFVPIVRNFRSILKTEIEAFVTNVFFVILDSKNSPIEHKSLVLTLFEEICSDPTTLAEIFLNYDCDLSAVDLFHRIVNTLSRVSKSTEMDHDASGIASASTSTLSFVAGAGAARMEKLRRTHRELRLVAMRAMRQVLASLHASIVVPMSAEAAAESAKVAKSNSTATLESTDVDEVRLEPVPKKSEKKTLVQIYDSKKKRREEESEVILRFNQKPSAGIAYAGKCGHVDASDETDVAGYLLKQKDVLEKTQIGEYLGREPDYQGGFSLRVLHEYVSLMDFTNLQFDDAIRYYLSGFRLPGEAQKIDRIMEKFAEHYTAQNLEVFPTADVAFILAFSIIMLNTDLHNPAIKEEKKMTKEGFIRNNRGICDGKDLPSDLLNSIYDRIKVNPFSLKEDDEARERVGDAANAAGGNLPTGLSPAAFFGSHYDELDRTKENNFQKERDQIVRTTESLLKRRRQGSISEPGKNTPKRKSATSGRRVRYVRTEDSGLRDEYVSPMFEVTWGPALAAFSMAIESANGTVGALLAIATDDELEQAAENTAETIEVCLTGFRFAICTAGLCGNYVARDSYMLALTRFSQLGTGGLLEPRHVRCIQTMLGLARSDGELLGSSWEHVFRALSEVNRYHQLFQLLARNDRVAAAAANRRQSRITESQRKKQERLERKAANDASDTLDEASVGSLGGASEGNLSIGETLFADEDMDFDEDEMNKKEIDEANARTVYEAVSEALIEAIYERSSSLSTEAVKEFILQLCRVSRMEISHYGGHVGSHANDVDLTQVHYRKHHSLLSTTSQSKEGDGFHHHQPNIYNLQKLVEVTHYNMDSRPRLVFADIWSLVAAHLTSTALQPNPAIAMYAVDSFRQLSIQYLQRDELGAFEFQKRFLKPLESVMSRSDLGTTKELLLKCIERIILMFGSPGGAHGGKLRSGWSPILAIIGLAGQDEDGNVAKLGFDMLTRQLAQCLSQTNHVGKATAGVLLAERFVDLVDALMMFVSGPHDQMSVVCVDHLISLSTFLSNDSFALPHVKKRAGTATAAAATAQSNSEDGETSPAEALELWWPILLGLSKSIGDDRTTVQRKSLEALFAIVSSNFLPKNKSESEGCLQTLQLIFRGVLTPVLEFGEVGPGEGRAPKPPQDFERFLVGSKSGDSNETKRHWLDALFDQFLDGCIGIFIKFTRVADDDSLVEEILAMINTCLLSDSGALAVRGLNRLEQFITSDLKPGSLDDKTWATVSHMLARCLTVRSLPRIQPTKEGETQTMSEEDQKEEMLEFVSEDSLLADRRYIGANAVAVITSFLDSERFAKSLGLKWRVMMVSGVGKAIKEWEQAASILQNHKGKTKSRGNNPPHYLETAYFARKSMNRYLLQLASSKDEGATAPIIEEGNGRQLNAQTVIKQETQSMVTAFLTLEAEISTESKKSALDVALFNKLSTLMTEMLAGYDKLSDERLDGMAWLNPVLGSCIHTGNESIRLAIQKLVKRLH